MNVTQKGEKHQSTTSSFSRSTNPHSQVTANTSCNVSLVGLCKNKGRAERVWVSLTRTFTHWARRELAYHYCKRCDVRRLLPPWIFSVSQPKVFSPLARMQTADLLKTPCVDVASPPQLGGAEPDKEAPYWAGLLGLCCRWRLQYKNTDC